MSELTFKSYAERDAALLGIKEDFVSDRLCVGTFHTGSLTLGWEGPARWCPITSIENSTGVHIDKDEHVGFWSKVDRLTFQGPGPQPTGGLLSKESLDYVVQQIQDAQIG